MITKVILNTHGNTCKVVTYKGEETTYTDNNTPNEAIHFYQSKNRNIRSISSCVTEYTIADMKEELVKNLEQAALDLYLYDDDYVEEKREARERWNELYDISKKENLEIDYNAILKGHGL